MTATAGEAPSRPSLIGYVLGGLALAALLAMSIWFLATGLMSFAVGRHCVHGDLADSGRAGLRVDPPTPVACCAAAGDCRGRLVRRSARRLGAARLDAMTQAQLALAPEWCAIMLAWLPTTVEACRS